CVAPLGAFSAAGPPCTRLRLPPDPIRASANVTFAPALSENEIVVSMPFWSGVEPSFSPLSFSATALIALLRLRAEPYGLVTICRHPSRRRASPALTRYCLPVAPAITAPPLDRVRLRLIARVGGEHARQPLAGDRAPAQLRGLPVRRRLALERTDVARRVAFLTALVGCQRL